MLRYSLLLAVAALALPAAHAETFSLNGTLSNGGTFAGTVDINTTTGIATSGSITLNTASYFTSGGGASSYTFTGTPISQTSNSNAFSALTDINFQDADSDVFSLGLPVASLSGYGGGNVCSASTTGNVCFGGFESYLYSPNQTAGHNVYDEVLTGTLLPASSAVPEPASLILLLTGTMGPALAARRRLFPRTR